MAEQTRLGLTATPSRPYAAFVAKEETTVWTDIVLRGVNAITGEYVYITGQHKET